MGSTTGIGLATVFAVSGSVVLLALHAHRRLLSDFMKKFELELSGSKKCTPTRKAVRFAGDVTEPSSGHSIKKCRTKHPKMQDVRKPAGGFAGCYGNPAADKRRAKGAMPPNRKMLYKGIIQYRTLMRTC